MYNKTICSLAVTGELNKRNDRNAAKVQSLTKDNIVTYVEHGQEHDEEMEEVDCARLGTLAQSTQTVGVTT